MNDEDLKNFLEDFKKGKIEDKVDMWFFANDQIAIWEEIIADMSKIATMEQLKSGTSVAAE